MDLIRTLMLKLEALPLDGHSVFAIGPHDEELAVAGASAGQIAYHLRLLREQGYLDSPGEPFLSGQTPFRGFTWAGHDFLFVNVREGSKPEKLNASPCFPLCP